MISKKTTKFIKSLQIKKYRKQEKVFLVEGTKSVLEVLDSDYKVRMLVCTSAFASKHTKRLSNDQIEVLVVSEEILSSISCYKTNHTVLAVVSSYENKFLKPKSAEFMLMLDNINDPGNMGTIVRIADWYGINKIVCSEESAELYNPKVISASMGSFTRVRLFYTNLAYYLRDLDPGLNIYGATLSGDNVHKINFSDGGVILIGNESHGLSDEVLTYVNNKINIPRYGNAESLNAAVATAIICDNLRRAR